jgi:hypothetical protein
MKKNIVFFGDSFASVTSNASGFAQRLPGRTISYIDQVAHAMDRNVVCLGFGGTSWWYSYVKLTAWINDNPEQWQNTEEIVMCLTDASRPKLDRDSDVVRLFGSKPRHHLASYNEQFERWAYSRFLDEIISYNKKTIMMPCFRNELWISEQYRHKFSTCAISLIDISHSEFVEPTQIRTTADLVRLTEVDKRANHLNEHNNLALAKDIVNQLQNYRTGLWMPDKKNYSVNNTLFDSEWAAGLDLVNKYSL